MKRKIRFLIAIVLAVLLCWVSSGCVVHQSHGVTGLVLDSKTGKPVQGAAVAVVHYETEGTLGGSSHYPESATEMTTDSEGKFILPKKLVWGLGAPENSHRIYIFEPNYEFIDIMSWEFSPTGKSPSVSLVDTNNEKIFRFRLSHLETEAQRKKNANEVFIHENAAITKQFSNFMKIVNTERHKYGLYDVHVWN